MAETIRLRDAQGSQGATVWRVIGHTDESCPAGKTARPECETYNQVLSERRAGTVRDLLDGKLGRGGSTRRAEGMGMMKPVVPVGFGRQEPTNRRVELLPVSQDVVADAGAADCPWSVRVFDPAMPAASGSAGVPPLTVLPNMPPLRVSRDARYEIRFDPSRAPAWPYYGAVSKPSNGLASNLVSDGGMQGNRVEALRSAGYRLPASPEMFFEVSPSGSLESIILSVATGQAPIADLMSQLKPDAPADRPGGGVVIADASPIRGLTKGPTGRTAFDNSAPDFVYPGGGSGSIAGSNPPSSKPVPAPPLATADIRSCRFTLSLL